MDIGPLTIQETLIEVTLDSNEIVFVRRLSPLAQSLILQEVEAKFPEPDKKQYERPLQNAAREGLMEPADANPEYKAALALARKRHNTALGAGILLAGVIHDTPEGREATIERYTKRLDYLRAIVKLPDDVWLATALYGLITTSADRKKVLDAAQDSLEAGDIRLAMRSFRY